MRKPELDWKWDPIALTALILSILAAISQLLAWARGPDVKLMPPQTIALYSDTAPNGSIIVRIAAPVSYANVAQSPYGTLVVEEHATLSVGSARSRQRWNAFGEISKSGINATGIAMPQSLPGQSAASHVTLFTPLPGPDYVTPQRLAEVIQDAGGLRFDFDVHLIDGSSLKAACKVTLNDTARKQMATLAQSNFYAACQPF